MSMAFKNFCLYLGVIAFSLCSTTLAQSDFASTEVKGGVVSSTKSSNIFDPSPGQLKQQTPDLSSSSKRAAEPSESIQEEEEQRPEEYAAPGPVNIDASRIAERASGDRSLMNALEQSRKLRERLGIVGGKRKDDPNARIEGIKKSVEKQKKLKEEQEYQF